MHFFAYKNPDFFCALICFIVIIWLELMSGYHVCSTTENSPMAPKKRFGCGNLRVIRLPCGMGKNN